MFLQQYNPIFHHQRERLRHSL